VVSERRWGEGTPSVDALVTAALQLLDRDGLAELSTRRVAQELGIHQPVIYRRVKDRDELLDLVVDRIMSEAGRIDPARLAWRDWLRQTGLAVRGAWLSHPHAGPLINRGGALPAITRFVDDVVGVLRSAGFAGESLLPPLQAYLGFVFSSVAMAGRLSSSDGGSRSLPAVDATEVPNLAELQVLLARATTGPDDLFAAGLEVVLDGVAASLASLRA